MTYTRLFIEYDRNKGRAEESRMASFLLSACGDAGHLYVDLYATEEDAIAISQPKYIQGASTHARPRLFEKLFMIKPISFYVCVQVVDIVHLTAMWETFTYSSPKIYRPIQTTLCGSDSALPCHFLDNFQYLALADLSDLLQTHPCIFRDFHDEIGIEVICRDNFEDRLKDLATKYLGDGVVKYSS